MWVTGGCHQGIYRMESGQESCVESLCFCSFFRFLLFPEDQVLPERFPHFIIVIESEKEGKMMMMMIDALIEYVRTKRLQWIIYSIPFSHNEFPLQYHMPPLA